MSCSVVEETLKGASTTSMSPLAMLLLSTPRLPGLDALTPLALLLVPLCANDVILWGICWAPAASGDHQSRTVCVVSRGSVHA
jgi:hypothetical protein